MGELVLERWGPDDAERLLEAVSVSIEHLCPWMPWAVGYDRDADERFLAGSARGWLAGERFEYGISDGDGALLGGVGMLARIDPGGLELGYWLHVEHTGRGIATRVAAALTGAALRLGAVTHVEIHHDEANRASGAIPERLGFQRLGVWDQQPQAPAETGREVRWRMRAEELRGSPAATLLEGSRR